MVKKQNIIIGILLISIMIFSLNLVSAAMSVVVTTPADSGTVTGTSAIIKATATNPIINFTCAFYAKSSSTANSSWTTLIATDTYQNDTATIWNATFNSLGLEDSDDYQFNATCTNGTDEVDDTSTSVTVDNTVPQSPTNLHPSNALQTSDVLEFFGTVTARNTTGCTLLLTAEDGIQQSHTMTHSGDKCSITLASLPFEEHDFFIRASDGTTTAESSVITFNYPIDSAPKIINETEIVSDEIEKKSILKPILIIGGIILVFWLIFKKW